MELIKFGHACFVATKNGQSIVVDPGELSPDFTPPENVVGIVVTHLHGDHWSVEHLTRMPGIPVFAPADAVEAMREFSLEAEAIKTGELELLAISRLPLQVVTTRSFIQIRRRARISVCSSIMARCTTRVIHLLNRVCQLKHSHFLSLPHG